MFLPGNIHICTASYIVFCFWSKNSTKKTHTAASKMKIQSAEQLAVTGVQRRQQITYVNICQTTDMWYMKTCIYIYKYT